MSIATLKIDGQKFRVIPEAEYKEFVAAQRLQRNQAKQDAADLAVADKRLKDPKRKTISLAKLKSDLGL